jgi:plastocyanin
MRSLRSVFAVLPLALAGCGGEPDDIDSRGIVRYGAFARDDGAPGAGAAATSVAAAVAQLPAGGNVPAAPATPEGAPGPAGGPGKRPGKAAKYEVVTVENGGTIQITCKATKAVEAFKFPLNKDQAGCGHPEMDSERAGVDPTTLAVKNCVVWLTDITKGKDFEGELAEAGRTVTLDQKSCRYVPHVMLVRQGSKVAIKNSDPVQHNVKSFLNNRATGQFNVMSSSNSLQEPGDDTTLGKAGNYILMCDIHFWMTGYIRAVAHPYWAVTGDDGTATLTNVPPGTYKVGCWHEGMKMKVVTKGAVVEGYEFSNDFELPPQDVTVEPGATAQVAFTIEPK